MISHPPQKRLHSHNFSLAINHKQLKREFCIRYLGILIDSNLNWKAGPRLKVLSRKLEEALVSFLDSDIMLA